MLFIDPLTCVYAKIIAHEVLSSKSLKPYPQEPSSKFKSRLYQHQLTAYRTIFHDHLENFDTDHKNFGKQFTKIIEKMRKLGKRHGKEKKQLQEFFSSTSWSNLKKDEKDKHTLVKCKMCSKEEKYKNMMQLFPADSDSTKHKAKILFEQNLPSSTPERKKLKEITKNIYDTASEEFVKEYPQLKFSKAQTLIPELNLTIKPSRAEKLEEKRQVARKFKNSTEKHLAETAVERYEEFNLN